MLQSKVSLVNQQYFIIEVLPFYNQATLVFYDETSQRAEIQKSWQFEDISQLNYFLRDLKNKEQPSFIFGLGSDLATTCYSSYKINRRNIRQIIDTAELESLISRLIWRCQSFSFASHLALSSVDVHSISIDGHKVTNPIGLSGGEVVIYFSKTLVSKSLLADIKKYLPFDRVAFIGEAGSVWTNTLARMAADFTEPFILASVFYNRTLLFSYKKRNIGFIKEIKWGEKNLTSCIFRALAIDRELARRALNIYYQQQMSRRLHNQLSAFFADELNTLTTAMRPALSNAQINKVYFLPFFHFPIKDVKLGRQARSQLVHRDWISQKSSFQLKLNQEATSLPNSFATIALLSELQAISTDSYINQITKRRLRWSQ